MLKNSYPYFVFDGNAAEAIEFYSDILDAKVLDITFFRDMPEESDFEMSDAVKNLVMNATIRLPNSDVFMFSDNLPEMPFTVGNQITTALIFDNADESRDVFEKLSVGGTVEMELQETFWSPLYGSLTDKFGNQWQIDTEMENTE
jgi:PhnB protein